MKNFWSRCGSNICYSSINNIILISLEIKYTELNKFPRESKKLLLKFHDKILFEAPKNLHQVTEI